MGESPAPTFRFTVLFPLERKNGRRNRSRGLSPAARPQGTAAAPPRSPDGARPRAAVAARSPHKLSGGHTHVPDVGGGRAGVTPDFCPNSNHSIILSTHYSSIAHGIQAINQNDSAKCGIFILAKDIPDFQKMLHQIFECFSPKTQP